MPNKSARAAVGIASSVVMSPVTPGTFPVIFLTVTMSRLVIASNFATRASSAASADGGGAGLLLLPSSRASMACATSAPVVVWRAVAASLRRFASSTSTLQLSWVVAISSDC
jgi:hypothetical protein